MIENNLKIKNPSPLVLAVVALDTCFSDLTRLSEKIATAELKSDFDFDQTQKLMNKFAECGEKIEIEVMNLSKALNEAKERAENSAQAVEARAGDLQSRQTEQQKKMEEFRMLGEKVRELTLSLNDFRRPEGVIPTREDQERIAKRLSDFELQLQPLIDEARHLRKEGQKAKMKVLEQGAESLSQSLMAISQKLSAFQKNQALH